MEQKLRRVEIKVAGRFIECSFSDVRKGDTFRLFEQDGTPVASDNGITEFVASIDSFEQHGVWVLETKDDEV